jgi:NhaP-type Na+/H+ or K+/H+ antiporter
VAALALLCGWLIPGLNGPGAILLGIIGAAGGDVFRTARQPLHTPRRVEEFLEVENLVTPAFLVTLLILALQATLNPKFGWSDIVAKIGLDLGLGVVIGIGLAFGLVWLRRQISFAPVIEIAVGFGTPYLLNFIASLLGISSLPMVIAGGFAVAVAYFRRPASDRGVSSLYRIEANGFWLVTNLLLGGLALFLIGLGLPGALRKIQASYGGEVLLYALAILIAVQLIRFGTAYFTFQFISKPASTQDHNYLDC